MILRFRIQVAQGANLLVRDLMNTGDPHILKRLREALIEITRKKLGMTVICDDDMNIEGIFTMIYAVSLIWEST